MSFVAERLIKVRFLFLLFVLSACRNAAIAADDVVINNFEADTYGNWVVKGEAFEPGPVQGAVDGQMPVSGVLGKGVANRFSKGDGGCRNHDVTGICDYRLPSEAEWEYACRAGTAPKYWVGDKDEDLVRAGWFWTNSGSRRHAAGDAQVGGDHAAGSRSRPDRLRRRTSSGRVSDVA